MAGGPAGRAIAKRPQVVVVFVSCLCMFLLAVCVMFYPVEIMARAWLTGLPFLGALTALLGLSVWRGSRVGWCFNVWAWAGVVIRALNTLRAGDAPGVVVESSMNFQLLNLIGASFLLVLLCWPSLFRWVWLRDQPDDVPRPLSTTASV